MKDAMDTGAHTEKQPDGGQQYGITLDEFVAHWKGWLMDYQDNLAFRH